MRCTFYHPAEKKQWERLVANSPQATFMLSRDFIGYHGNRFEDASVMIFSGDELKMVLPANRKSRGQIVSHQGLTYGGFVFDPSCKSIEKIRLIGKCLQFLEANGTECIHYKALPLQYIPSGNGEIEFVLQKLKAQFIRCDYASVVPLFTKSNYQKRRVRGTKKATRNGLRIEESSEWETFWKEVLSPNLTKKYGLKPVHAAEEIIHLKEKFPENIRLFTVSGCGQILSGCGLFETPFCDHAQYIATSPQGLKTGGSDLLFQFLMERAKKNRKHYFSLGVSQEEGGTRFNAGLTEWKESWGSQSFAHSHWLIETKNHVLLDL